MKKAVKCCLLILLLFTAGRANANHIFGADFYYTYVTGNTYTITLALYADCQGIGSGNNPNMASPLVAIYNGVNRVQTVNLALQAPTNGVEVTPVCAAQLNNTQCTNAFSSIPGIKKYIYSTNVNLGGTSANWLFQFTDTMGFNSSIFSWMVAGRSTSFTNINTSPVSLMVLEATLNNTSVSNSSPTYTTLPTPFFIVNKAGSFNPGTVDVNNDSLAYDLVPGLNDAGTIVTYNPSYTADRPLAATAGTFSFDSTNGQLDFTPNITQNSLVVYKVTEYRNGIPVGTSMREMTFVVINGSNDPPSGNINTVTGGRRKNKATVLACQGQLSFNITPTDANGDAITMSYSGLPAGASLTITSNGTTTTRGVFSWNATTVAPGNYTFFITYADNGCPLKSTQTLAYTVTVLPPPDFTYALQSQATCIKKGVYKVNTVVSADTMKLLVLQSGVAIDSSESTMGVMIDSLAGGTYTLRMLNGAGCNKDTTIVIDNPTTTQLGLVFDQPTCNQFSDGVINITASNGTAPYQYALGAGAFGSSSSFTALPSGSYTVRIKDAKQCIKDTVIILHDSISMTATATATNVQCNGQNNGAIVISGAHSGYGMPYTFKLDGIAQANPNIQNLRPATYIIRAEDRRGCYWLDTITITEPMPLVLQTTVNNISCFGSNDGTISASSTGGTPAYTYNLNGGGSGVTPLFTGLTAGQYILQVNDANGCLQKDTVTIYEPKAIEILNVNVTHPLCADSSNGSITVASTGGTPAYTYTAQGQTSTTGTITRLAEGTFKVTITDSRGCIKDTMVLLNAPPRIHASVDIQNATCNMLDDGIIAVAARGGFGAYIYALSDDNFTKKQRYHPLGACTYTVRIKDGNGCIIDTTVTIQDSLKVVATSQATDVSCYGNSDGVITFAPAGGVAPYSLSFNTDGNYTPNVTYSGYPAGEYRVWIKDALGCTGEALARIREPQPLVADTGAVLYNNCYGNTLTSKIEVKVAGGTSPYTYTWSTGKTGAENVLQNLANGSYTVYIQDAHGCKDTVSALLEYKDCCQPYIPNAFTPNGDGKNDVFRLRSKGDIKLKDFQIFNRFGQCVFTGNDVDKGWDGNFNGTPVDVGTYFYFLKAVCGNGEEYPVEIKGDVVLIR